MVCNGSCDRYYKFDRIAIDPLSDPHSSLYALGAKRCQICCIFLKWDGIFCPCCGYKLRTRPRSKKSKARYEFEKNAKMNPSEIKRQMEIKRLVMESNETS